MIFAANEIDNISDRVFGKVRAARLGKAYLRQPSPDQPQRLVADSRLIGRVHLVTDADDANLVVRGHPYQL